MGFFDSVKKVIGGDVNTPPPPNQAINSMKKSVLIVEDEQALADALQIKLEQAGFQVFKALNGQEGLDSVKNNKPDIILLDLMMPVMDGKTMLHHLRQIPECKDLPVLILTNAGDIENMNETKTYYNAIDFLIKSNIDPDQVVERVKQVLI